MKRLLLLLALSALAVTAACGSNDNPAVTSAGSGGDHNEADVAFAQGMIPHHEQAIEMAEMALEKSEDPKITDLAKRIIKAQGPEIAKLTAWLEDWDEPVESDGGGHGGDTKDSGGGHGASKSGGMMSEDDMSALENGADFDKMFLEMMTEHHEGAIEMAQTELGEGKFPAAKAMAQEIIDAQQAELAEMKDLLEGSSSSPTTTEAP